jgi:putative type-1 restriction enzyme hindVIIP specificity protein
MQKVLSDICYYVSDKIPVKQVQLADYVSTENLLQNKGGLSVANKLPSGKVTAFQAGDVLVSNIRPYFKKIWLADRSGGASNDVLVFRKLNDEIYEKYLYYILADDRFFAFSTASASGSKMPRGDKVQIMNYPVKLPPLESQKKIADILSSLDEKIELNRRMNETLEQLGQALFRYYFVDNPEAKNWKRGVISDLGEVVTGKTPSKKNQKFFGDEVAFLKVPDMHKTSIVIKTSDNLSLMGAESQKSKYISRWSTCVSCIATVGVVSLAGKNMQTNQQINSIIPRESYFKFFNYFLMRHKSDYIKTLASSGSATPNLNMGHFSNITVVIPDRELLKEFDARVNHLFLQMENNLQENETLMNIRDSLLLKLISGEIIL